MVGHQAIAVDHQAIAVTGLAEGLKEAQAVAVVVEDRLPPVPAVRVVVVSALELYPWFPGHTSIFACKGGLCQESRIDPE